nr:MAG TPA: hypothetical protein [Caudoviricetes sp.]
MSFNSSEFNFRGEVSFNRLFSKSVNLCFSFFMILLTEAFFHFSSKPS